MKKKVFCVLLCSVLIIAFAINCFAYQFFPESNSTPTDLGDIVTDTTNIPNGFYYLKITVGGSYTTQIFQYTTNDQFRGLTNIIMDGSSIRTEALHSSLPSGGITGIRAFVRFLSSPTKIIQDNYGTYYYYDNFSGFIYVLIAVANDGNYPIRFIPHQGIELYTTVGAPVVDTDYYYMLGYTDGFNTGFDDGVNTAITGTQQLNLVQHVNKAVGFFIGEEYAPYVTPFAIAFTLLLAYFIFIRWILLFGKSTKAMKIADIVVVAACIGIMAVMYINMFTINIHNTNVTESVYQIASDVSVGG